MENREWELPRADLGVGPGGPGPPFCGLLNFSALHVQYGIQAFAKCKHPECIRLHPRELQSQKFPVGASAQNSLEKSVVRSPDGCYRAHIATVYNIPRPPPITKSSVRPWLPAAPSEKGPSTCRQKNIHPVVSPPDKSSPLAYIEMNSILYNVLKLGFF